MLDAMQRSTNPAYTNRFLNVSAPYIVYASQIRPSKNVLNLLRAYQHLLKKRFLGHKLVLTGDPQVLPEVDDFIKANQLARDVVFLRRLSTLELAACYRLADLAVNPSLGEGGCPFTFTEALSVDTPVVMARIPVTTETLDDPALADMMFFDPYEWRDMADRIEWAILNRTKLLALQKAAYDVHAKRTWDDVVTEYVQILEEISSPAGQRQRGMR
jgi:glycosyltransferase involved in cell wall biosynthesis